MSIRRVLPAAVATLYIGACLAAEPLVLVNGNVYTADSRAPRAQAVIAGEVAYAEDRSAK